MDLCVSEYVCVRTQGESKDRKRADEIDNKQLAKMPAALRISHPSASLTLLAESRQPKRYIKKQHRSTKENIRAFRQ